MSTTQLVKLTNTERKVISLVADIKSNDEIADILGVSKRTIENHKVKISKKLQLESSRFLLKYAMQYKDVLG